MMTFTGKLRGVMIDLNYKHSELTSKIIKAYFNVYNKLGYGFLEKVYANSMLIELKKLGLRCRAQAHIKVFYDSQEVGFYLADIIVNDAVIIETKAAQCLCEEHEAQLINYLKASDMEVGMLLNFGRKAEFRRKVFSTEFKTLLHNDISPEKKS